MAGATTVRTRVSAKAEKTSGALPESGKTVQDRPGDPVDGKLSSEKYILKLEEENRRLKLAVADLTLRNQALKSVVSKKW